MSPDKWGIIRLAKNPQSKDDSLEALDFIVNVLKEHEKDLDKLINELATVTEQLGDTGDIGGKVEKVEEKISSLQKEVTNLMSYISGVGPKEPLPTGAKEMQEAMPTASPVQAGGPSVILRCKQWEDFQNLASQAQTLSFNYKEEDKVFQADALKGNRIITYSGALPKFSQIVKAWLSKELSVPDKSILEGVLTIS
ncbi:MAG: hypothetical protein ACLQO7_14505 [Candidatus Bathyarchaeia archaeon]